MLTFQNISIRHKLRLIIMVTSCMTLLLACFAFIAYDAVTFREQLVNKESSLATAIGSTVTAAIDFNDRKTAEESLAALRAEPNLIAACIYDGSGQVFATYQRDRGARDYVFPAAGMAGHEFKGGQLHLVQEVKQGNVREGMIFVVSDMTEFYQRLKHYAGIVGLVFLAALLMAYVLSYQLQGVIANPILQLAQVARAVAQEEKYSVRATKVCNDELGQLVDCFNEMLNQIQLRDAALLRVHDALDQRVAARTAELAESLSVLDATLSSATDGILVVNRAGKKIYQNQRAVDLWKIPSAIADNHDGETQLQYVSTQVAEPESFLEKVRYFYAHPDERGQTETMLKDGTILERITAPVAGKDGQNYGRIWMFRDVTESRRNEMALRESQARFKFIFESVPVGIALHRQYPDGRFDRIINDAHLRICGLTREQDQLPDIYKQITHPDDFKRQMALERAMQASGDNHYSLEKRYVRLDGQVVWVVFSFQRQAYSDGSFDRLTTVIDITEQKAADEALRESEALYYSLVDQLPAGIYRKDSAGRYVFVNASFCGLKGLDAEAILGQTPLALAACELARHGDPAAVEAQITQRAVQNEHDHQTILRTGQTIEVEEEYPGPQGRPRYWRVLKFPARGADGKIVGSQGLYLDITDRKQAEAELAYERDLLRELLANAPDQIYFKDLQFRYIKASNSQLEHFGVKNIKEILGKTDADFFTEAYARSAQEEEQKIISTGQSPKGRVRKQVLSDGRVAWALTNKMPMFNSAGQIIGTIGISKDITALKQTEAELAYERDLLETLLNTAPDSIFFKDRQSRLVKVSRSEAKYLMEIALRRERAANPNAAPDQLPPHLTSLERFYEYVIGKTDLDIYGPDHAAVFNQDEQTILQTGQPMIGKMEPMVCPDGSTFWYLTTKIPWRNQAGEIIGTFGISKDITTLKQTEGELAYERDLLRALLENAPDHIYFKDAQSRFIKSSAAQARQFGVASADELVGKSDFDFFSAEHARPAFEDEQEIIRTGKPIVGKVEKETWQDGRKDSWVLTTKMPFRDKTGEIIGTFGISKDITPIKEAEAKLKEAHEQLLETSRLAGMAEVATNVLHNVGNVLNSVNISSTLVLDSLKQSKMPYLGKAVALLDEHAADLGVFITTDAKGKQLPGYLIKLAGQLAGEQTTAINELLSLRQNIEHIKDIVAMQQSYAKISGVTETVKLTDLVEDALRMNAGALARHDVELIREYTEVPPVTLEKHKVLQILVNLIRNAKYACDDSGRSDKKLRVQVSKNDTWIQIAIIDNGIGIPAENLTRIFNHGFTTRKLGHGFGLHSGALAAKELGGSLSAQSAGLKQGATFILKLPLQPPKTEG